MPWHLERVVIVSVDEVATAYRHVLKVLRTKLLRDMVCNAVAYVPHRVGRLGRD